jgi:hypothetical protein
MSPPTRKCRPRTTGTLQTDATSITDQNSRDVNDWAAVIPMSIHPGEVCRDCGDQAERTVGAVALCICCADEILDPIRDRVIEAATLDGVGYQIGVLRPEFGRHAADLECCSCRASWVGIPGEPCGWCERRRNAAVIEQGELVLRSPLPHSSDVRFDAAAAAWAERLAVAVRAGIVGEAEARRVFRQAVPDVAA